jgi:hypothetical protein
MKNKNYMPPERQDLSYLSEKNSKISEGVTRGDRAITLS